MSEEEKRVKVMNLDDWLLFFGSLIEAIVT